MLDALNTLTAPQVSVMQHATRPETLLAAGGAVRSGKTFATTIGFAAWAMHEHPTRNFIIAGVSVEAIMRNVVNDFINCLSELGFMPRLILSGGNRIICGKATFYIVGANDEKAAGRIQGMTAAGALLDEVALQPKSFFMQVMARLSVAGNKAWLTYNPENPAHWLKREVLDKLTEWRGREVRFSLEDNPSLPEEVKARYRDSFTGHFRARFIEGLWCAPSGLIFPEWKTTAERPEKPTEWLVGADWGVSNTYAALLIARQRGKPDIVVEELYHDARADRVRTEAEQHEATMKWLAGRRPRAFFLDPSTPASFKRLLRESGINARNADNDVDAGIRVTATALAKGDILIGEGCAKLRDELMGYQWDEKKANQGEDAPVKAADHACDALRYYAFTTRKIAYSIGAIQKPRGM